MGWFIKNFNTLLRRDLKLFLLLLNYALHDKHVSSLDFIVSWSISFEEFQNSLEVANRGNRGRPTPTLIWTSPNE